MLEALTHPLSLKEGGRVGDQLLDGINRALHKLFSEVEVSTYVQVVPQRGRLKKDQPGQKAYVCQRDEDSF